MNRRWFVLGVAGLLVPAVSFAAVQRRADLIVTALKWSANFGGTFSNNSVDVGDDVWFRAVVKNQGNAATPSTRIIRVDFRVNGTLVAWSNVLTGSLAAGASRTLTATGGPDSDEFWRVLNAGTYTILARVDPANIIVELSDNNNIKTTSLTAVALPPPPPPPPDPGEDHYTNLEVYLQ